MRSSIPATLLRLAALLALTAGASSCGAATPGGDGPVARGEPVDADHDGHPEDLRVQVSLPRVPAGRWTATVQLARTPRARTAAPAGDELLAHSTPSSEHRALEPPLTVESTGRGPCTLAGYFRGDDVATLAPGVPLPLRVRLRPAGGLDATTVREWSTTLRVADPAAYLQTPVRVVGGALEPGGAAARVELLLARGDALIVQASVVEGVTALRTGRANTPATAGRCTVRVPLAATPEAAAKASGEPRRLVVEIVRPRDASVLAAWDTPLAPAR